MGIQNSVNGIHFYIVVVSFNPGKKLQKTLESIYRQDYRDYEVVIEDSESNDQSLSSLRGSGFFDSDIAKDRTHIFVEKDRGIYDGMNLALSRITGEQSNCEITAPILGRCYVMFLNCGDVFHDRQVLGRIADAAEEYAAEQGEVKDSDRPVIFYGDQYNLKTGSIVASSPKLNEFSLYRNVPCHQVCIYNLSLFTDRAYDITYKVRADYEHFLYCVYKRNAVTKYVDVIVSDYEGGGYSETGDSKRISEKEHNKITSQYMGDKVRKYRLLLKLTGAGLRTKLAEDPRYSNIYNGIKSRIYALKR